MRISVSEWTALKLAVRLPRAFVNPKLWAPALSRAPLTRRGMALIAFVLLAVFVLLHVLGAGGNVRRNVDLVASLAEVKLIDARWDAAIARARVGTSNAPAAVQETDGARIQRTLEVADVRAPTEALRASAVTLKRDYVEKIDLVTRFERASIDSRESLAAALRADPTVAAAVREAWRDYPQRDRLVAAENLVLRVLTDAQQYRETPTAALRSTLETHAADLGAAKGLPRNVQAILGRLETDMHRLLLLIPLEHATGERLRALDTQRKLDELADVYQRELADSIVRRDRYLMVLIAYSLVLLVLIGYFGVRAITRFRDLEVLYSRQTRELAKTLRQLATYARPVRPTPTPTRAAPGEEDASVVSEERRNV